MEKVICAKYDKKYCPDYCPHKEAHEETEYCKNRCDIPDTKITCTPVKQEPTMKEINEKLDKILQILQEKDSGKVSCNSYNGNYCSSYCTHINNHVHNDECEDFCYTRNKLVRCV